MEESFPDRSRSANTVNATTKHVLEGLVLGWVSLAPWAQRLGLLGRDGRSTPGASLLCFLGTWCWPVSRVGQLAGPPGLKGGCAPSAQFLVTVGNSSFSGAREPCGPALPFLPSLADSQPSEDPATGENQSWLHPQTQARQRLHQTNPQPPAPGAWGCTLTGKRAPAGSLPSPCGSVPECSCACSPLGPGRVLVGR